MATKHQKDDYTLEQWDRKIQEEEAAWRHAGMDLNQMTFSGHDIFFALARIQALTNVVVEGELTEENLNLHLKNIVYTSMSEIRENVAPQLEQMKARQKVDIPKIIMPWERDNHGPKS